jgi:VWFA-related protein
MRIHVLFLTALLFMAVLGVSGQTPPVTLDDDVVKITSKLVQFDVIVRDKQGKQVTDLAPGDFEVLQDGKPQTITNFSYVNVERLTRPAVKPQNKDVPVPPVRTDPAGIKRVVTFIVDDGSCYTSMTGVSTARDALEKFINRQMLPGDAVAIYQTRGGSSMLQQYTPDKQLLLNIVRKIKWYPSPGMCVVTGGESFDPIQQDNNDNQVMGSIGLMRYVVQGLDRLPGRKVVFFLSDGLPVYSGRGSFTRAFEALRDLTDQANRASVIFHTIFAGGLGDSSMINAQDSLTIARNATIRQRREAETRSLRDGLFYLADETGGGYYTNRNFLDTAIEEALSLEKGYYLIAYEPDDATFKGRNFNKLEIKVKRPGLEILTRAGFLGVTDEASKPKKRTGNTELYEAIIAPLPQAGLKVRLTAYFVNTLAGGNFVRSMFHVEGNEIMFVDEANGFKKAVFDVVAVTLNEKNEVVDEFTRTHTFKIEAAALPLIRQNGLVYSTDVPIKKAGTYNYRVAVRDAGSGMLGSSSQVVEIKDLKKGALLLSGLSITQADEKGRFTRPSAVNPENALSLPTTRAVPAIRRFQQGAILAFLYTIFNARLDVAGQPKLSIQINLFRDGQIISEGTPQPADLQKQTDLSRIEDYGYLQLKRDVELGDYAIQVIVKDLSSSGDKSVSSQWIDFEVVP